jgi:uncharacterized RDD family membrane protein YckC
MRDRTLSALGLLIAAAAMANGDGTRRDGLFSRVASRATGAVVDIVDPEKIVEQIDVNALMERVDVNALLERVDPQVLLDHVDVDALMDRVDVDALLDRVDVDALMTRVDIDALLDRVDVKELTDRAGIPDIVRESTGALAGSAMDVVRRQIVAIDAITGRWTYHLIGRDPQTRPVAPAALEVNTGTDEEGRGQVTGHFAGPVSRLAAFILDSFIVWIAFVVFIAGFVFVVEFFTSIDLDTSWRTSLVGVIAAAIWAFTYLWVSLALAGRTPGMGRVGLSVLTREGSPISGRQAVVRTLVFPLSFLMWGLGFLGIFISPTRRTLHDAAAGTVVVYDWGDRPAEMPAPFTQWVDRHTEAD